MQSSNAQQGRYRLKQLLLEGGERTTTVEFIDPVGNLCNQDASWHFNLNPDCSKSEIGMKILMRDD